MGSYLSWMWSSKDPRTPVKGIVPRIKNIFKVHFRGVLGILVPLLLLSWQPSKGAHDVTVRCIWMLMFWFMLIHPVAVPATGFVPLFMLPMCGAVATKDVAGNYFNDNICLFVLAGMLQMLINSSGLDRRIILWLLCSGDSCQFSGKRLVFKASTAAFFLSMFSNRLITASTITQFLTPAFNNLQSITSRNRKTEPDFDEMRYIVLNAVQTSSALGSVTIIHASVTTITMRAIWCTNLGTTAEYADIFNYLQYTCFAFPVAFITFIVNFSYHMMVINWKIGKPMTGSHMNEMKSFLKKQQNALPPPNLFEKETFFFYFLFLIVTFFRWCEWLNLGWATYRTTMPGSPMIKDATVAAIFLVGLSILPRYHNFMKYIRAKTKSDLTPLKPESAILWWKFVDKNTYYGYVILLGGTVVLNNAIRTTELSKKVASDYGKFITDQSWNFAIFIICLISVILANIMTGIAACCIFLPFVLNMVGDESSDVWKKGLYLGTLAVGIGTSFGYCCPFFCTPAYFCYYTGKVPIKKMIKYGIFSAIICLIILWLALCFYAPLIFDSENKGISVHDLLTGGAATTKAPGEGGQPGSPEGL